MESPWKLRALSALGLVLMAGVAWLCSENRRRTPWRLVLWALGLQFALGLLVLRTDLGRGFFQWVKTGFDLISAGSAKGANFVFGNLTEFFLIPQVLQPGADGAMAESGPFAINCAIAFNVLPVIIFVSALAGLLQHLGIVQAVVRGMAWLMRRTLKTSGAETVGASLLVFLGIESVSAISLYIQRMTRSELFVIMVAFLATIAASVMVAYASFGAEPGHLLAASLMSAPAAIAMAKIMVPETGTPETAGAERVNLPVESHNVFDAIARGASVGLNMALHVGAMLIVFVGIIYLLDLGVVRLTGQTSTALLGWVMRPFAFFMGVPASDIPAVSELLATKSVINEFLAYGAIPDMLEAGRLSPRGLTIATYALCGFANPGSLGILLGAMAGMAPERRADVAALTLRAYVAGTLACFSTACVAGLLT